MLYFYSNIYYASVFSSDMIMAKRIVNGLDNKLEIFLSPLPIHELMTLLENPTEWSSEGIDLNKPIYEYKIRPNLLPLKAVMINRCGMDFTLAPLKKMKDYTFFIPPISNFIDKIIKYLLTRRRGVCLKDLGTDKKRFAILDRYVNRAPMQINSLWLTKKYAPEAFAKMKKQTAPNITHLSLDLKEAYSSFCLVLEREIQPPLNLCTDTESKGN